MFNKMSPSHAYANLRSLCICLVRKFFLKTSRIIKQTCSLQIFVIVINLTVFYGSGMLQFTYAHVTIMHVTSIKFVFAKNVTNNNTIYELITVHM